jgi:hypothetical protein
MAFGSPLLLIADSLSLDSPEMLSLLAYRLFYQLQPLRDERCILPHAACVSNASIPFNSVLNLGSTLTNVNFTCTLY